MNWSICLYFNIIALGGFVFFVTLFIIKKGIGLGTLNWHILEWWWSNPWWEVGVHFSFPTSSKNPRSCGLGTITRKRRKPTPAIITPGTVKERPQFDWKRIKLECSEDKGLLYLDKSSSNQTSENISQTCVRVPEAHDQSTSALLRCWPYYPFEN